MATITSENFIIVHIDWGQFKVGIEDAKADLLRRTNSRKAKGIGEKLTNQLLDYARTNGFHYVFLTTSYANIPLIVSTKSWDSEKLC